ncbi:hypothetical protein CEXT_321141 [Caerostris extrusa]|uniref:Uncharacterized protein n=1 Tax=Caerostris extrusa TaxID=172846 RepID=A0AAV4VR22_CAEEX|nr:hypothetical protein CEXT_321141 [Caerostris extrusa]
MSETKPKGKNIIVTIFHSIQSRKQWSDRHNLRGVKTAFVKLADSIKRQNTNGSYAPVGSSTLGCVYDYIVDRHFVMTANQKLAFRCLKQLAFFVCCLS